VQRPLREGQIAANLQCFRGWKGFLSSRSAARTSALYPEFPGQVQTENISFTQRWHSDYRWIGRRLLCDQMIYVP
jgi:hypothetical protein